MAVYTYTLSFIIRLKYGYQKASVSESCIKHLKRKIYQCLRSHLDDQWVDLIPDLVHNFNATPNPHIGNLRPADITSREDGPMIQEAIKSMSSSSNYKPSEPDYNHKEKPTNTTDNELTKGSYVMVSRIKKAFTKSSDYQVTRKTFFTFY